MLLRGCRISGSGNEPENLVTDQSGCQSCIFEPRAVLYRMPMSKTKELAKKLGLVKSKRKLNNSGDNSNPRKRRKGQLFSHVIVIDFESTCWKDKRGAQEIIEFPAVLLDLCTGEIAAEFQQYVQPQENPRLSEFCRELTGITQDQVNNGVPLPTCLMLFGRWLRKLREERGVLLIEPGEKYSEDMTLCALVTWTDWDLGVCLMYECQRKQIRKQTYFSQWIDLRAVYKKFYERSPSGLSGALEDLGIPFTGRQHSGIDDARNTAKLCHRMVRDGCRLNITKCIHSKNQPALIRPPTSQHSSSSSSPSVHSGTSGSVTSCEEPADQVSSKLVQPTTETLSKETKSKGNDDTVENNTSDTVKLDLCQQDSELSPRHSGVSLESLPSSVSGDPFPDSKSWGSFDDEFIKDVALELDRWESDTYLPQEEKQQQWETLLHQEAATPSVHNNKDRCLDGVKGIAPALSPAPTSSVCTSHVSSITDKPFSSCFTSNGHTAVNTPSRAQYISHVAPVTLLQGSSSSNHSAGVQTMLELSPCCSMGNIKNGCCGVASTGTRTPIVKTSNQTCSTIPSCSKRSPSINELFSPTIQLETPSPPTNLQQSGNKQSRQSAQKPCKPLGNSELKTPSPCSTGKEFHTPSTAEWMKVKMHNVTPLTSSREPLMTLNGGKVTPPLCNCGKRAKRKLVTNPGPNEGKPFYVCPQGRGSNCGYFRWECSSPYSTSPQSRTAKSPSSFLGQSPDILCSEYTE